MTKLNLLHTEISKVCPINGISCDGRIDYQISATDVQKSIAQNIMEAYLTNPQIWEPAPNSDEILEYAMRKCETHFEAEGFSPFRVQDLFADLLDDSTPSARKGRILQVKAWLRQCRDATTSNPSGVLDNSIILPNAPLKYSEI